MFGVDNAKPGLASHDWRDAGITAQQSLRKASRGLRAGELTPRESGLVHEARGRAGGHFYRATSLSR